MYNYGSYRKIKTEVSPFWTTCTSAGALVYHKTLNIIRHGI